MMVTGSAKGGGPAEKQRRYRKYQRLEAECVAREEVQADARRSGFICGWFGETDERQRVGRGCAAAQGREGGEKGSSGGGESVSLRSL